MRSLKIFAAIAAVCLALPAAAQLTLDIPLDEPVPYFSDSGLIANVSADSAVVYEEDVTIEDALWLRLYFGDVQLAEGSFLRLTSQYDGEVQELDAAALAMWSNSSAYFNGDSVKVELVAGPSTQRNRLVVEEVAFEHNASIPVGGCGICGPDDRVLSDVDWASRLIPAGCSATIYNSDSCAVTAGHCISGGMVLQFKVPTSNVNCSVNHPPVNEQFPVINFSFANAGVGNDWGVLVMGTNGLGEKPYDRYGALKPIASTPAAVSDAATIWGYGVDSECTKSQAQQTSDGAVTGVGSLFFNHNVDATFGNSGSSLVRDGSEIIGIATHCPCPNWATRVDHPSFSAARETLCPEAPAVAATVLSFDVVIGTYVSGDVGDVADSDGSYLVVDSVTTGPRNNTLTEFVIQDPFGDSISELNLTVEYGPTVVSPVFYAVQVFNEDTVNWDNMEFGIASDDSSTVISLPAIPNPGAYTDAAGQIRVRVGQTAREPQTPGGFTKRIDHVGVTLKP